MALFALVFLLLAGVTLGAGWYVQTLDRALARQRFLQAAEEARTALSQRMRTYEVVLRGAAGLMNVAPYIDRGRWHHYVSQLALDRNYPGQQALGYAERVSLDELGAFESRVQREGFPGFHIRPTGARAEYFPVLYVEPFDARNRRAFGFDALYEPVRRQALIRARDSGQPTFSAPVHLVQETGRDGQAGVLLVWPIYRQGVAIQTVGDRRAFLQGYVYSAFRMNDLIANALGRRAQLLSFRLLDADAPAAVPLYDDRRSGVAPRFNHTVPIEVAGRTWLLTMASTQAYEATLGDSRTVPVIGFGLLISLLVGLYTYSRERAHRQMSDMADKLRQREERFRLVIEGAPNAMLMVGSDGKIELVNAQSERLFGYSRAELIGQPVELLLPERYRGGHRGLRAQYQTAPESRRMGIGRELFALRKDGTEVPVEVGLAPIQTDAGMMTLSSIIDLTERKRAETRFRMAVEASPNAIVLVNAQGRIELVNTQTEALFGYTRGELIGQPIELLVPDSGRAHARELREAYMGVSAPRTLGVSRELLARHKSGREIPIELGLAPIHAGDDQLVQAAIIDISARRNVEQRLKEQAQALEQVNRYKSEFLANMSHELRTPLNSILVLSEQLKRNPQGNLAPRQVMHAEIIHRSGTDLLYLINDILDLSKIEAGRMTLSLEPVNLHELVTELDATFRTQADGRQLEFTLHVAPQVPTHIETDRLRLLQILKNLMSNAIKFTEAGSVRLDVGYAGDAMPPSMAAEAALTFAVRDTGVGIPPEKFDHIFEAFQQLDGSTSRRYGGTGLGLTICRQLASLLGGVITLDSVQGVGSIFTLYLPVAALRDESVVAPPAVEDIEPVASESENAARCAPVPGPPAPVIDTPQPVAGEPNADAPFRGRRVLLVDDDVRNIYAMCAMLEQLGFDVLTARHGEEALQRLVTQAADLVLMDMAMPVMDGYTATRILKTERGYASPIIALTAHAMKGDRERCLAAGADDYLAKPVTEPQLRDTLARWLPSEESKHGVASTPSGPSHPAAGGRQTG